MNAINNDLSSLAEVASIALAIEMNSVASIALAIEMIGSCNLSSNSLQVYTIPPVPQGVVCENTA